MAGPDNGLDLINAMIRGGEKAVSEFSWISGGEWFDEAPEYFLTTYVATSIRNFNNTFSLLEVSVDGTRKSAGASRLGRPAKHERRNGRFDVVVYWGNDTPRGAVEIKSPIWSVTENLIQPDIDELCSALCANRNSTLQFGSFIFYASAGDPDRMHNSASERLRDLLKRIDEFSTKLAKNHGIDNILIPGAIHRGDNVDGGAWCIAALVFTRKGSKQLFSGLKGIQ